MLNKKTAEEVESAVYATIKGIREDRELPALDFGPDDKLNATLGLRSIDLAQIVLDLEDALGTDPFQEIPITSIRTVGDVVNAYKQGLGLIEAASQDDGVEAALEAARRRRERRG
jgi:acyl carrier protein